MERIAEDQEIARRVAVVEEEEDYNFADGPPEGMVRVQAVTDARKDVMEMRGQLRGVLWTGAKQIMDLMEVSIADDRRWAIAREMVLTAVNQQERVMARIVQDFLGGSNGKEPTGGTTRTS